MIKQEMVLMLHHDALIVPTDHQIINKKGQITIHNRNQHMSYLEQHEYHEVSPVEMEEVFLAPYAYFLAFFVLAFFNSGFLFCFFQAKKLLEQEMKVVKKGMGHGELTSQAYNQVWEECLSQVLLTSVIQNLFTLCTSALCVLF